MQVVAEIHKVLRRPEGDVRSLGTAMSGAKGS